jgi:hypothetical protein
MAYSNKGSSSSRRQQQQPEQLQQGGSYMTRLPISQVKYALT